MQKRSLVDLGHVGENIYLASTSIGLGTCGIGACVTRICDEMFELEGENEFIIYAHPVGKVNKEDFVKENSFYILRFWFRNREIRYVKKL